MEQQAGAELDLAKVGLSAEIELNLTVEYQIWCYINSSYI